MVFLGGLPTGLEWGAVDPTAYLACLSVSGSRALAWKSELALSTSASFWSLKAASASLSLNEVASGTENCRDVSGLL